MSLLRPKKKCIKLKHLDIVYDKDTDFEKIVYQIIGFKDRWIDKILKYRIKKVYKQAIQITKEVKNRNSLTDKLDVNCPIKVPASIDNITFRAMMELNATIEQGVTTELQDFIAHVITIVCFSQNTKSDYDSETAEWLQFKDKISDQPIIPMLIIYHWIQKAITESQILWEKRFLTIRVNDEDYEKVGGPEKIAPFNIINTLKNLCQEFNISYQQAWQMSYAITQTNNYAKATWSHIQDEMRQVKELRMKQERKKYGG